MKITMTIVVNIDEEICNLKNEEERWWFENEVLVNDGSLLLHSNEIGDTVGTIINIKNIKY